MTFVYSNDDKRFGVIAQSRELSQCTRLPPSPTSFLCTNCGLAEFETGTAIVVDGGYLLI